MKDNIMSQAQIVTIGQELLRGDIGNSNAVYLARELNKCGIHVQQIITLADDVENASKQLKQCMIEEGVVIITGGLGGTADDVTRTILSSILERELIVDKKGEDHLRKWYKGRGRSFSEDDRLQASYPKSGNLLENSVGLAYGFYVRCNKRHIFSLPGVPAEMKTMFQSGVLPKLKKLGLAVSRNRHATLNFATISEYTLDRIVNGIVHGYDGVTYGTRASNGFIRIHFESNSDHLDDCISEVERELKDNLVYRGSHNLEEEVGTILQAQSHTVSVAESCTGGLLAKVLTDVPGSSGYFLGGVVAYSNEVKRQLLGVTNETLKKFGAVSEKTAVEMAHGAINRFSSTFALSVTGIAGPGGGTAQKPVGTVYICAAGRDGYVQVEKGQYMGDRDTVRKRSANKALTMLLFHLNELQVRVS